METVVTLVVLALATIIGIHLSNKQRNESSELTESEGDKTNQILFPEPDHEKECTPRPIEGPSYGIRCFYHPDRAAVGICQVCGKGLCRKCAEKHNPCLCDECYDSLRKQETAEFEEAKQRFIITLIISGILAIAFLIYAFIAWDEPATWLIAAIIFFLPFGWRYSKIGKGLIYFNNIAGWILMISLFVIRIAWAVINGVFAFFIAIVQLSRARHNAQTDEIEGLEKDQTTKAKDSMSV